MNLTALDIIVLLSASGGALVGFGRGFVREVLSLAALLVAIVAVKFGHGALTRVLTDPVGTESGASILAFAILFGLTFLVGRMIAARIGTASRQSVLGPLDRVLGFGFGALKGLVLVTLVFLFLSLVYDTAYGGRSDRPLWMTQSRTYPLLRAGSEAIVDYIARRRAE